MKSLYAETQENNNYNFNNRNRNVKCNFENLFTILFNAKSGNKKSILFFIEKYQFLIKKYAFKYKLKNYDADDFDTSLTAYTDLIDNKEIDIYFHKLNFGDK